MIDIIARLLLAASIFAAAPAEFARSVAAPGVAAVTADPSAA